MFDDYWEMLIVCEKLENSGNQKEKVLRSQKSFLNQGVNQDKLFLLFVCLVAHMIWSTSSY